MKAAAVPRFRVPKLGPAPQFIAFVLVLALLGAMAIEPTRQLLAQRDRISGMAAELRAAHAANARLEAQIARLNNDDYIEQRARAQIGLVRPGRRRMSSCPRATPTASASGASRSRLRHLPRASSSRCSISSASARCVRIRRRE